VGRSTGCCQGVDEGGRADDAAQHVRPHARLIPALSRSDVPFNRPGASWPRRRPTHMHPAESRRQGPWPRGRARTSMRSPH